MAPVTADGQNNKIWEVAVALYAAAKMACLALTQA